MVLQLTSLIPSLAGTLRYSAGVTAFTFSLSSGVKPQFTQAPRDLTHQRSLGHLSTKSVTPNSDPCPQQLLPLHSAQLKAPGCNHPLILEKNSSSPSLTALWQLPSHHSWNEAPVQLLNCVSSTEKVLPHGCTNRLTPTVWGKVEGVTLTVPRTLLSQPCYSVRGITTCCPYEIHPARTFPQV